MSNTKVAVYGSLRKGLGNHRLLSHVRGHSKGVTTEPFSMYSLGGFPAIVPDEVEGAGVVVEVYDVDDNTLQTLNSLEGYYNEEDYWYNRKSVDVVLDGTGEVVSAYIYFFDDHPVGNEVVINNDWKDYLSNK